MRTIFQRAWSSTTITTWASYFTRSANLLFVLPLILRNFGEAEVAVYYLFASILAMSGIADFGFKTTFIRLIAYAAAGAKSIDGFRDIKALKTDTAETNWTMVERLYSMTTRIYLYVSIVILILLGTLGSMAINRTISLTDNSFNLWISWAIIVGTTPIGFYGKAYLCYLEGFNKIALVRRVETLFLASAIISKTIVLLVSPSILNLVIVEKIWVIINLLRNYYLAGHINSGRLHEFKKQAFDIILFKKVWKPAWRSGASSLMSIGLTNLTGIFYAQIGTTASVASYLLALKIITQIRDVSMAPLYSKIPLMAKLRAENNIVNLAKVARRGMFIAHMVFIFAVLIVGLSAQSIIQMIGSKTEFVSPTLWFLLSVAFLVHRYGAMHMQVYLTTNHVITHIVDGVSGLIFILAAGLLLHKYGVYAFPMGMIIGYLCCHAWVSPKYSLSSINQGFWQFEKNNLLLFFLFILINLVMIV